MCGQWRNSVYEARGSGLTLAAGLLARYSFDDSANPAGDDSGNGHNGVTEGGVTFVPGGGDHGTVASFDGTGRIVVDSFINWAWGNAFSVSVWFNRGCLDGACIGGAVCDGNYVGIVSNGYYHRGSFEVRMGREDECTMIGGGVITSGHEVAWDHVHQHAALGAWHHVAMVYDSSDLHFFLDGAQATSAADSGDMVIRPNELVIGKAGPGLGTRNQPINEYFLGMIDDVRLWARVLTTSEVLSLAGQ